MKTPLLILLFAASLGSQVLGGKGKIGGTAVLKRTPASVLTRTDNFTRSNETPIAGNWTVNPGTGSVNLASNKAIGAGGSEDVAYWNADTFNNDQYAQITIGSVTDFAGAGVRIDSGAFTGYFLANGGGTNLYLFKYIAAGQTILASTAVTVTTGDTLKIVVSGTSITCYQNGSIVSALTKTDSDISSGQPGIFFFGTTGTISSWTGSN